MTERDIKTGRSCRGFLSLPAGCPPAMPPSLGSGGYVSWGPGRWSGCLEYDPQCSSCAENGWIFVCLCTWGADRWSRCLGCDPQPSGCAQSGWMFMCLCAHWGQTGGLVLWDVTQSLPVVHRTAGCLCVICLHHNRSAHHPTCHTCADILLFPVALRLHISPSHMTQTECHSPWT